MFLGHRIDMLCGDQMVGWEAWIIAMDVVSNYSLIRTWTGSLHSAPATAIVQFWMAKLDNTVSYTKNICKLVLTFSSNYCEDIRDKAYALLGLASNPGNITVDYQCSVPELLGSLLREWPHMDLKEHKVKLVQLFDVFKVSDYGTLEVDAPADKLLGSHQISKVPIPIFRLPAPAVFKCRCLHCCRVYQMRESSSSVEYALFKGLRGLSVIDIYLNEVELGFKFFFREMKDGTRLYLATGTASSPDSVLLYYDETIAGAFETNDTTSIAVTLPVILRLLLHKQLASILTRDSIYDLRVPYHFERIGTSPSFPKGMLPGMKNKAWASLSDTLSSISNSQPTQQGKKRRKTGDRRRRRTKKYSDRQHERIGK